jgi:hypothetical protein
VCSNWRRKEWQPIDRSLRRRGGRGAPPRGSPRRDARRRVFDLLIVLSPNGARHLKPRSERSAGLGSRGASYVAKAPTGRDKYQPALRPRCIPAAQRLSRPFRPSCVCVVSKTRGCGRPPPRAIAVSAFQALKRLDSDACAQTELAYLGPVFSPRGTNSIVTSVPRAGIRSVQASNSSPSSCLSVLLIAKSSIESGKFETQIRSPPSAR